MRTRRDAVRGVDEGLRGGAEGAVRRCTLPSRHRISCARATRCDRNRPPPLMTTPFVFIVMGSDSDAEVMSQAAAALDEFGVPYQMTVASAHRSPERTKTIISDAETNGAAVFIAGAGMAAHLPGVVASFTTKPVIGVPLAGSALQGVDALYAIVQMPPGIPVASVAIGGARNAGILAAQIIATADAELATRLRENRKSMAEAVAAKSKKVEKS